MQIADTQQTIVLVDDDTRLSKLIAEFLNDEGFNAHPVFDGNTAIEEVLARQPDLVILDIMLPGIDGVEVCRQIRKSYSNPIIMLTAAANDFAEITSLNNGADSYLDKPVKPQVLLAHIHAALRRHQTFSPKNGPLLVQDIELDSANRKVLMAGNEIELTSAEFELLYTLMVNAGSTVSRDDLYQEVRGIDYDGLDRAIDLRISQLRRKLADDSSPYKYIKTIRNKGYLFASG